MVELEITREGIVAVFANCVDEKTDGNRGTDCGEDKEIDGVFLDGLSRVGKDGVGKDGGGRHRSGVGGGEENTVQPSALYMFSFG